MPMRPKLGLRDLLPAALKRPVGCEDPFSGGQLSRQRRPPHTAATPGWMRRRRAAALGNARSRGFAGAAIAWVGAEDGGWAEHGSRSGSPTPRAGARIPIPGHRLHGRERPACFAIVAIDRHDVLAFVPRSRTMREPSPRRSAWPVHLRSGPEDDLGPAIVTRIEVLVGFRRFSQRQIMGDDEGRSRTTPVDQVA
jgi:hypothetical protein